METGQSPYEWVKNREGYTVLLRTKHPRLAIEVQDEADEKKLADALRKAAEFVLKGERIEKPKAVELRCVVRKDEKLCAVGIDQLSPSDDDNIIGDICDDECGTFCMYYRKGECPYRKMRMADGEFVRVLELR